jgi:plasmid rolling circle replication initiator protein Rep
MAADTAAVEQFLSDLSPKDKPWDRHKIDTISVRYMYQKEQEFQRYAERMGSCSGCLEFALKTDAKTGEVTYKLKRAHFCRVRHCPVCQWRRCLLWRAKFAEVWPKVQKENPTARTLYLVFTVKNCETIDLRETLKSMNKAWNRFVQRKEFKDFSLGWIRTTEVTRGKDGSAHPHFNLLLLVKAGYFKGQNYMSRDKWSALWRDCARLDYDPQVWVSIPKDKKKKPKAGENQLPSNAVMEALKYSVKPADMLQDAEWFYELNRQVKNLRFIATGGVFKNFLKDEAQITEEDMIFLREKDQEESDEETENIVAFLWNNTKKRYMKGFDYTAQKAPKIEAQDQDEAAWASKIQALYRGESPEPKPKPGPGSGSGSGISFCSGAAVD